MKKARRFSAKKDRLANYLPSLAVPHEIKLGFITKNIEFLTEMSKEAVFPLLSLSFGRKAPRFFHRLCHFFVSNATYEAEILKVNHKFYFENMF